MDKLLVEEVEALRDGLFKPGGFVYVPNNFNDYPDIVKMLRVCGQVTRQLADTMRENERLRTAAEKVWHTSCEQDGTTQAAREHAEAMQRLWREIGMPDHPYKHSGDITQRAVILSNGVKVTCKEPKYEDGECVKIAYVFADGSEKVIWEKPAKHSGLELDIELHDSISHPKFKADGTIDSSSKHSSDMVGWDCPYCHMPLPDPPAKTSGDTK